MNINFIITSLISVGIAFGVLVVARAIIHAIFKKEYTSVTEIEKNNISVALRNAGIYIGIAIAMIGVISSPVEQLIDGFSAMIFVIVASTISDKIIFSKIDNTKEIGEGNISLALAEFGVFVGTGIIALGSFTGTGPYISSIVFFIIGQIVLIGTILLAELFYKNIKNEIINGKVSAGLFLGSMIISMSIILKSALIGDFTGYTQDILSFLEYAIFGYILMFIFANKLIDFIFLPKSKILENIEKDNISALAIVSAIKLSIAFIISGVII
jgi:uncharacterized membrane protein YjfL (UPF0719 family)